MTKLIVTNASYEVTTGRSAVSLIKRINLEFESGELVGVLGPNGAGKSTLVKLLAGLAQPTEGSVTLEGTEIAALNPRVRAQRIAYLAQQVGVAWSLAVKDVIELGCTAHGARDNAELIFEVAQRTRVERLLERSIHSLSGGELMRVHIARLLAAQASIILADEPIAGLDPYYQLEVMETLRNEAIQKMVVVVLHDLSMALRFCDRVVVIDDGSVAADGPPKNVLDPALLDRVYRIDAHQLDYGAGTIIVPANKSSDVAE